MLEKISSVDAKTNLSELLHRVETGEAFTITIQGKPIADIVPSRLVSHFKTEAAINNILNEKKYKVSDQLLSDLKEHGRI